MEDVKKRDDQDSHRAAAPLRRAEVASLVDISELDVDQGFETLKKIIAEKLG